MNDDELTGWRKKDRYRFRNPDLVAVFDETDCREVFDLHEVICDLIDEERRNGVNVSLRTLCGAIHDRPRGEAEWEKRVAALEGLRRRGLVLFDGDVGVYSELEISVPDRVYNRWFEAAKHNRPRDPETGKFLSRAELEQRAAELEPYIVDTPDVPEGLELLTEVEAQRRALQEEARRAALSGRACLIADRDHAGVMTGSAGAA